MASSSGVTSGVNEDVYSFQLEEDDLEAVPVGNEGEEEGIDDRWCLVGRFLSNRMIDFDKMQNILASLWQPGMGMFVKKLDDNRFLFQFYHEVDILRVINGSPWTFDRMKLIIQRLPVGGDSNLIQLNHLEMWIQIHDVKSGCMTEGTVRGLANTLGKFIESDPKNFIGVWRDYLRVRVTLDIRKALRRRIKLTRDDGSWFWLCHKKLTRTSGREGCVTMGGSRRCTPDLERNHTTHSAENHAYANLLHQGENHGVDSAMMENDQEESNDGIEEGEVKGANKGKNKEQENINKGSAELVVYDSKKRKVGEGLIGGHLGQAQESIGLPKNGYGAGLGVGARLPL
uniref:DUF4283 domain-containing protein n=1 Tax=Cannabis sativa TaxID=3483 RepID=A0A803NIF1_CANSA